MNMWPRWTERLLRPCRDLDGKVFDIDDYKPGTNAPPMHCWCRSCIVPYFDDMEMLGKRAARDPETGKTILVPEDMTYREWEKKYWNNEHSYRQAVGTPNCNIEYINSKEYKKKFSDLTPDNRLNNLIYERCKAAIIHQNGDYFEDLSVISADECKIVGVTSSKIRNETLYTDKLINDISTYGKGSLISVHNHGTNLPPSGSDLQSAGFRGYRFGIVACHDGKVYYYSTLNAKPFLGILYDKRVDTYRKKPYNVSEEVAMLLALDSVARDYGIEWRELI